MSCVVRRGSYCITTFSMNLGKTIFNALWIVSGFVFCACSDMRDTASQVNVLPCIYPDYCGVTVPSNIAPLNFCMEDEEYTSMEVHVKGSVKGEMESDHTQPRKRCVICGNPVLSKSHRAKYCPACSLQERRRRDAQRKRVQYWNLRI